LGLLSGFIPICDQLKSCTELIAGEEMSIPRNAADIIVIGAGAAGLAAAIDLRKAGLSVLVLEARDRIGGRILTQRDPVCNAPIELGAEFIHGVTPEIWGPLQSRNILISEVDGDAWCFQKNKLTPCDYFSRIDDILQQMDPSLPDESFLSFLDRRYPDAEIRAEMRESKRLALGYVTGFNAADASRVGVHWLAEEMAAEEKIEGDRAFRSANGYEDLVEIFRQELVQTGVLLKTETVVHSVEWKGAQVNVDARNGGELFSLTAGRVLVTLPLGVWQASPMDLGGVRFDPPLPREKLGALKKLVMGHAMRVTLRFRHRFWDNISPAQGNSKSLTGMSFLFSQDDWFPTWWTTLPQRLPIITAWAAADCADRMAGKSRDFIIDRCLQTLGSLLGIAPAELSRLLEIAYFHNWQDDAYSRGAYSYGAVGSDGAQQALGSPLENKLFFAGEATDTTGNNGTVHSAISSGHRAAREIVGGLQK
jgi:monoamine oxidase